MHPFWNRSPALLIAIATAIGTAASLFHIAYLFFLFAIGSRRHMLIGTLVAVITFCATSLRHDLPDLPDDGMEGTGVLCISSLTYSHNSYMSSYVYRGTIDGDWGRNIPVSVYLNAEANYDRPAADKDWLIQGTLKKGRTGNYTLKVKKESPWIPIAHTYNLSEWRYHAKNALKNYINKFCTHTDSIHFLSGIATGDYDDKLLQFELSRFGVQHIMAISGFHFNILIAFLGAIIRQFLQPRATVLTLMFLLTGYFLFLGAGPSILRAYVTIMLTLLAILFERDSSGTNILGLSCLLLLAYDPLLLTSIGFAFSAISTASILILFPIADKFLSSKKPLSICSLMDQTNQLGYCCLTSLRQAFAMGAAINCTTIPLTLLFFKKFPLMSIFFNLFFPFLVSFCLVLLLFALLIPPLAPLLFYVNDAFTHYILTLTSQLTFNLDFKISQPWFLNSAVVSLLLFGLLHIANKCQNNFYNKNPFEKNRAIRQNLLSHGDRSSVG